jgi:hypothetical protein
VAPTSPAEQPLALSPCPGCGFDYDATPVDDARRIIHRGTAAAGTLLGGDATLLRRRPAPNVWSPLEYGAHMRDVLTAQRERVILAVIEDVALFAPLHRDERVSLLRYNDERPAVAAALILGAELLWLGGGLTDAQLERRCTYDLPEPTQVDAAWVFVHTAHEVHHHLGDMERGMDRAAGGGG